MPKYIYILLIALVALFVYGSAQAQEASPTAPVMALTIWRCEPTMAVRIENRGDEISEVGYYMWAGDSTVQHLETISPGYSMFFQHPTATVFYLFTYNPTQIQRVECGKLFLPMIGG